MFKLPTMRVCDHLGNFSDDLEKLILENIKQICEDPSTFVEQIIVLLHSKIVTVLRESPYFPHQLRELMERALPTLQAKSAILALPLQGLMGSPQAMAACSVIKNSPSTSNNPAVTQLVESIKSTIDENIKTLCSSTEQTAPQTPTGGRRRRRTSKKSRKSKQTRRRKSIRRH